MKKGGNITSDKFCEMLKRFIKANGYVPTIREMCTLVGLNSTATVHYHLDKLEREGKIKRIHIRKIEFLEEENDRPGR